MVDYLYIHGTKCIKQIPKGAKPSERGGQIDPRGGPNHLRTERMN